MTPNQTKRASVRSTVLIPVQDTDAPIGQQGKHLLSTDFGGGGNGGGGIVTTIADFRASDDFNTSLIVTTIDFGGGTWYYYGIKGDDDPTVDDTGTTIITADNRIWKRIYSGSLNSDWFGVVGDNTTNDLAALQATFDAAYQLKQNVFMPPCKCKCGYTTPLVIKGDTILIQGSGAATNATENGTIIYGKVEIGDNTTDATRGVMRDISILGPGTQDQIDRVLHSGIGILVVKSLEFLFSNVSVEGFKYGLAPYPDPTISILQVNTITIDHCRFYNNKICNIEMGRGGHALTITNGTNISFSEYNVVIGVIDKTTDTIVYGNTEPLLTINITNGNTIQSWRKKGIVVCHAKKVTIRDNYFELGYFYQNADEAILLGTTATATTYFGTGNGMEYNVMCPVIDGNWFFLQTNANTYKANSCCIRVISVKKGAITNNLLNNLPYPVLENDTQLADTYLIKNDEAVLDEDVTYSGNSAIYAREMTKEYVITDAGYNVFHDSFSFSFVGDRPLFLKEESNKMKYMGTVYNVSRLAGGGGDPNAEGAIFGMLVTDTLKFPAVTGNNTTIIV